MRKEEDASDGDPPMGAKGNSRLQLREKYGRKRVGGRRCGADKGKET